MHMHLEQRVGIVKWGGYGEVEFERVEQNGLHLQELGAGVGIIGDVDEILDFGATHLLILGRDKQGAWTGFFSKKKKGDARRLANVKKKKKKGEHD